MGEEIKKLNYKGKPLYVTQPILDELNVEEGADLTLREMDNCLNLGGSFNKPNNSEEIQYLKIEKKVSFVKKGWFKRTLFRPISRMDSYKVTVRQFKLDEKIYGPIPIAGASFEINDEQKGLKILECEIPFPMPPGKATLLMQVYLISKMPDWEYPEYQRVLEKFCFSFPEFRPPDKLWWGKEAII